LQKSNKLGKEYSQINPLITKNRLERSRTLPYFISALKMLHKSVKKLTGEYRNFTIPMHLIESIT